MVYDPLYRNRLWRMITSTLEKDGRHCLFFLQSGWWIATSSHQRFIARVINSVDGQPNLRRLVEAWKGQNRHFKLNTMSIATPTDKSFRTSFDIRWIDIRRIVIWRSGLQRIGFRRIRIRRTGIRRNGRIPLAQQLHKIQKHGTKTLFHSLFRILVK